jgi:tetratricopeptide (TPR) repeat protein
MLFLPGAPTSVVRPRSLAWPLVVTALAVLVLAPAPDDLLAVGAIRTGDAAVAGYDYPAAVAAYQLAAARQAWNATAWLRLARVHLAMGENLTAFYDGFAAAARSVNISEAQAEQGVALARLGNPGLAVAAWRQAAADPWLRVGTLAHIADGYYMLGMWDEAEAAYRRLVTAGPRPEATYRLGLLLAPRQPEAARSYLAAAAPDPGFTTNTTIVLEALSGAADPDYDAARLGVAFARVGEWRLAERLLAAVTQRTPDYAQALAYLGLARDRLGQDGYPPLAQALALAPRDPLVHVLMGYHWKHIGGWEAARMEFEQAYDLDPANAAVCVEIGLMYAAKGDYTTAGIWLAEATRLAPNDPAFWKARAQFYLDRAFEVEREGLSAARRALELAPDDAEAHDLVGWALFLGGDTAGATTALNEALRLNASLASAHYHLGLVYEQEGDQGAARQTFARAAALDPGGPIARLAQRAQSP